MRGVIEQEIKRILVDELRVKQETVDDLRPGTPLLGKGVGLDSMEILALVTGLEEAFGIQIEDSELSAELFRNLSCVTGLVLQKIEAGCVSGE